MSKERSGRWRGLATAARAALVPLALAAPTAGRAAAQDPTVIARGEALLGHGNLDAAKDLFETALASHPNVAEYHYWAGRVYGELAQHASVFHRMGYAKKIREEFARALELDPDHVGARIGLINFYDRAPGMVGGDDDKALAEAEELVRRHPCAAQQMLSDSVDEVKDTVREALEEVREERADAREDRDDTRRGSDQAAPPRCRS